MTRRFTAILLTLLALTLVACSSDDDSSDATAAATEAMTSEATASSGGAEGGSSSAPDVSEIGVPLPDWADAVAVDDAGPVKVVQFIVPLDQQDETVAFYEAWVDGQPDEYLRTEGASGGLTLQSDTPEGENRTIIAILSPLEGDDFVTVTLTVGALE
ncbi:MAG: hypothetical protein R3C39_07270 [Dehalococcoidia bacterium]